MTGYTGYPDAGPQGYSPSPPPGYQPPAGYAPSAPSYPAPPTYPSGPSYPAPPPGKPARRGRSRIPILILALVAIAGLLLIGISQIVEADAENAFLAAENECEFNPPTGPSCTGYEGEDNSNIETQAENAEDNASATADTLFAFGFTLAAAGIGLGGVLMLLRRMDRIESGGNNPPE